MHISLGHHGMCSELLKIVSILYEIEYNNLPVNKLTISWSGNSCTYTNDNSNKNVFTNFFIESEYSFKEHKKIVNKFNYKNNIPLLKKYIIRDKTSSIIQKYLKIIPSIQNNIDLSLDKYNNGIKIGCHIRGRRYTEFNFSSDIYKDCKSHEQFMITYLNKYEKKIEEIINTLEIENSDKNIYVFIFTDNSPSLQYFINKNKDGCNRYKLVYYNDIIKADRFFKAEIHTQKNKNKDIIGNNIIKELFTMNKMDHFISELHGNVPIFVVNSNSKLIHHPI